MIEIAAHPLALHHDFFRRKHRFRRRSLHQRNGGFGKKFEAVGRIKMEHGAGGGKKLRRNRHYSGLNLNQDKAASCRQYK